VGRLPLEAADTSAAIASIARFCPLRAPWSASSWSQSVPSRSPVPP